MSLIEKYLTDEHRIFSDTAKKYFRNEVLPHVQKWEKDGIIPKEVWKDFAAQGFMCSFLPEEYGGSGTDFLYTFLLLEAAQTASFLSYFWHLHSDVVVPYIYSYGTEEQKRKWLHKCASGEYLTAVSMTEPNAGSDLAAISTTAVKDGDYYIINGQKTFVSNGINSDLIVTAVKTDPKANPPHKGISLIVVEDGTPGLVRGRKLDKVGMRAQDTAEIAFVDCRVPKANLLGQEGHGFKYLMEKLQQERIVCALVAQFMAEDALRQTISYTKDRKAFGKPISRHQYISFELAKLATEIEIGRTFVESLVIDHMEGKDIIKQASMAKYWNSEMLNNVVERCVQFHGGYGYMEEYTIARLFRDARVQTIYAGSSEIMLMITSRYLDL